MKNFLLVSALLLWALPALAELDCVWVRRYNGPANGSDAAFAMSLGDSGNIYVTGRSDGLGTDYDYATVKYYPNGDTGWVRRYNGPADSADEAHAIAVDGSGNIYVTGHSHGLGTEADYATIKYYPDGDTAWIRRYNGTGNSDDQALAIAVDGYGNVYVTGYSTGAETYRDYATIKYYSNGDTAWVRKYNGTADSNDVARDIAVDGSGNVYVTGYTGSSETREDYTTIKYSPSGDTAWVRTYDGSGHVNDCAYSVAVDPLGGVCVTGYSYGDGAGYDYATIKYYQDGDTAWVRRYNGRTARALAVDDSGNVCVTGESVGDFCTIRYYPNGDTAWLRKYNGPASARDEACALAVNDVGDVHVTGYSYGVGTSTDYATVTYDENGDMLWLARYDGPPSYGDVAYALALDQVGNTYVTGGSIGDGTSWDFATIKYAEALQLTFPNGGEVLNVDATYGIAWDQFGVKNVSIEYSTDQGSSWSPVTVVAGSDGSYPWKVPNTPSDHCLVRISDTRDGDPADTSDACFLIVCNPGIAVNWPNGGEELHVDVTYDVTWDLFCVDSVKIEYSTDQGSGWLPIAVASRSDESYPWKVPNTPSEECLIRISDAQDGDPADTSDGSFAIVCQQEIEVRSPDGGERWRTGDQYSITWDYICFYDSVSIEYSTDAGATWNIIVDTTENDGIHPWTVPEAHSESCLVRISHALDSIPSDTSDGFFCMVPWIRGDANGDGMIDVADPIYILNYLFKAGDPPTPPEAGDATSNGVVDLGDCVFLLGYLFKNHPAPGC